MQTILRTDSSHTHFKELVQEFDADLAGRDGRDHSFYNQFNKIDNIRYAAVAYHTNKPVSCGAIKEYAPGTMEVKRMYTVPQYRGNGFAALVLKELEVWAKELGAETCILETGKRQPEAIRLYERAGYEYIPNYGQYAGVENSVCFQKRL